MIFFFFINVPLVKLCMEVSLFPKINVIKLNEYLHSVHFNLNLKCNFGKPILLILFYFYGSL